VYGPVEIRALVDDHAGVAAKFQDHAQDTFKSFAFDDFEDLVDESPGQRKLVHAVLQGRVSCGGYLVCQILPSRVIEVREAEAEVELPDGQRTSVSTLITPAASVGDYVLVDRGFIVQTISADEAQAIIALYAEMNSQAGLP